MLNYSDIVQACNHRTGSHHWTVQCLFSCLHHLRSHVLSKVCIPKLKSLVSLAMGIFAEHPFCPFFFVCVCSPNQGAGLLGTQYSTRSHGELSNIEAGHTIHRHEVRFTLYFCQTRQPNFWQMMLTNMLCVLPASAEDARIDDGSHKSNSPKNAEATGISDTPQMDLVRGTHVEMRKSFLMKGSSRTGWQAEMLTFFQQLPDKFLCERYIWLPY